MMTALRSPGGVEFPPTFEERVPDNAKQVRAEELKDRWLFDGRVMAVTCCAVVAPSILRRCCYSACSVLVAAAPVSTTWCTMVLDAARCCYTVAIWIS